jgi:pimeloyl-ACP methyl ester carboxylesterase
VISAPQQPAEVMAAHAAMATRNVIASRSAHFIHFDEPELVTAEIQRVVANALLRADSRPT